MWGEDQLWYNEETHPDYKYSIQVDDEEITVWDFMNGGNRSFATKDLNNPSFNIAGIFMSPEPNRTSMSVQEGRFLCIENYDRWDWLAVSWLHARLTRQLEAVDKGNAPEGVKKNNRIDVQPTMFRYSVQLDESDLIYNLTHKEILDQHFSPEWVIDQILMAQRVLAENRGDRFTDKQFSNYVVLMLGMMRIPGQQSKIKRRRNKKCVLDPTGGKGAWKPMKTS